MKTIIRLIILCYVLFLSGYLFGQQNPWELWLNPDTDDFAIIQQNVQNHYQDIDLRSRGTGYKQYKRWEYMMQNRLTNDGKIQNYSARNFHEYQDYIASNSSRGVASTYGFWISLGPEYFVDGNGWNGGMGRVNCIAFHPSDPDVFWIGCPSGGLWKTMNGGANWIPLTDGMTRIGVSGIAVNYNNPDVIYILTGDGDGEDLNSIGVLKTTNSGVTWYSTGLTWDESSNIRGYKLLIHPTSPSILFVAGTDGIFKTLNSGYSWTQVMTGYIFDIEFKPGDPTIVYACGVSSFYRSTDTGETWNQITSGVPTGAMRMAIGVSPANSDYVYIFAGPALSAGTYAGTYISTNSGGGFSPRSTTPNILGYSPTGDDDEDQNLYDHAIAVSRLDDKDVLIGGINCWYSGTWGATWTLSSMWNTPPGNDYTHADIHALEINPLNNYLYCGSDGGIFRTTDFGVTWTDLSQGLAITQTYRFAGVESDVNLFINGTQDEGSNKWTGGSTFLHVLGADGMDCMIDYSNTNILYNSKYNGALLKSIDGGASYTDIKPAGSSGPWVTPFVMNPSNSNIIYGGYSDIYKSTDGGTSWLNLGCCGTGAMAHGVDNLNVLYASAAGTNDIYVTYDAGATWNVATGNLPVGGITCIAVNPDNALEAWVSYRGYSEDSKVFRLIGGGVGLFWENMTGSLPNIPVNCIIFEDTDGAPDNAVYIGTDVGVYYRDDDIGDWIPFMNGLPNCIVMDMEINYTSSVITIATYGRGFWRSSLYSDCPAWYILTQANDPSNPNYTGFQHYEASDTVWSSRIITGGEGTDVYYQAGILVRLKQGFHARSGNKFQAVIAPCSGTEPIPPAGNIITGTYAGPMPEED